jgi:hypothetical protein
VGGATERPVRSACKRRGIVIRRAFFSFFPCNHIIKIKNTFLLFFFGEVKDKA